MPAPFLTGCWLAVAAASARYDATLHGHTRVRTATALEAPAGGVASDLQLEPRLRLALREQNLEGWLSYAPRLTLRQARSHTREELLHTGRLRGEWRVRPGLSLYAEEHATYGTVDLLTQQVDMPVLGEGAEELPDEVPLQPVPVGAVDFASSRTEVGGETTLLHPRLRLRATLDFTSGGGREGRAREALPVQTGPRFQAEGRYALAPRDALTTTFTATDLHFSTGRRASFVQLDEVWEHRLSRATDLELGGGVGVSWSRPEGDAPSHRGVLLGAMAAVHHRLLSRERPLEARATARLVPFVDRLTGGIYPRFESTLLLTWTATSRLWFYGQGGVARAVGGGTQGGDTLVLGLVGANWRLAPGLDLEANVRHHTQRSLGGQRAERSEWAATLGVSVSHAGMF